MTKTNQRTFARRGPSKAANAARRLAHSYVPPKFPTAPALVDLVGTGVAAKTLGINRETARSLATALRAANITNGIGPNANLLWDRRILEDFRERMDADIRQRDVVVEARQARARERRARREQRADVDAAFAQAQVTSGVLPAATVEAYQWHPLLDQLDRVAAKLDTMQKLFEFFCKELGLVLPEVRQTPTNGSDGQPEVQA
jgi:hypothetical protein